MNIYPNVTRSSSLPCGRSLIQYFMGIFGGSILIVRILSIVMNDNHVLMIKWIVFGSWNEIKITLGFPKIGVMCTWRHRGLTKMS